jgi:hypothetical protein
MTHPRRAIACLIAAATVFAALSGCTGSSEPTIALPTSDANGTHSLPPTTGSSRNSATPSDATGETSTRATERRVLDSYLGLQRAFVSASRTADPQYPGLSRYASGAALQLLTNGLTSMRKEGLRSKGETYFHPKLQELAPARTPTKARVIDCMDTRQATAYKADGSPYTDTPGGRRLAVADLELTGGTWKVTGLGVHEVGSCAG